MTWLWPVISYLGGLITVAVVNEILKRFFDVPRVRLSISDVALSRTKHRSHASLPVPEEMRLLLSEGPTSRINWDEEFVSEHAIDLSILELVEREQKLALWKTDLQGRIGSLTAANVRDHVLSIGRNQNLLAMVLVNALVRYNEELDPLPTPPKLKQQYPIHKVAKEKDGEAREFIHLDLPGNPFPVIGSTSGNKVVNDKAVALAYALAFCDHEVLAAILRLGVKYCDQRAAETTRLRVMLEQLKREQSHLELRVIVANLGAQPAFVSTEGDISIGAIRPPLVLAVVDDIVPIDGENTDWMAMIGDAVRRLSDWIPSKKAQLKAYSSVIRTVVIPPGGTKTLHFVSVQKVSQPIIEAVSAMQTGYTTCSISVVQYIPRRRKWLARFGRFHKRITGVQKLTASREV